LISREDAECLQPKKAVSGQNAIRRQPLLTTGGGVCDSAFMALNKDDLTEIRTIVTEVVTTAIEKNNEAIAGMFETQSRTMDEKFSAQDERIDAKFAAQDERIDERFMLERIEIRDIIRSELAPIRERLERLETLHLVDIQSALDEIQALKTRLSALEARFNQPVTA
jgi:hypothetical protein